MDQQTDQQLLTSYARQRSDAAFAELVRRHIDFVYSAALRMVTDAHRAEDITQAVFIALSQNAARLSSHPMVSGWLHRTTRNIAGNTIRSEIRRHHREQEAVAMNELASESNWDGIAEHLDAGMDSMDDADRDILFLSYFQRRSSREIGQQLGISEEAARKRINRAVEQLRHFFANQRVTIGAGSLVAMISTNAVQSAPATLAKMITAAAIARAGGSPVFAWAKGALKFMASTKIKAMITTGVVILLAAGTIAVSAEWLKNRHETGKAQVAVLASFVEGPVSDAEQILKHFTQPQAPTDPTSKAFDDLIAQYPAAKILSKPRILTGDGMEAIMSSTRAVKVNGVDTNAGITVHVTPTVEERAVALKIRAELSELTQDTPPAIRVTTIEQSVKLVPGNMVELLKDIPGNNPGETNRLLIFISPQIVDAGARPRSRRH